MTVNEIVNKYLSEVSGAIGPEASKIISKLLDALFDLENKLDDFSVDGADFETIIAYYNNKPLEIIDNNDGSATVNYNKKEIADNIKDKRSLLKLLKRKVI